MSDADGNKPPGLREVADRAGVSTATASRALRRLPSVAALTLRKVEEAAAALGYDPAKPAETRAEPPRALPVSKGVQASRARRRPDIRDIARAAGVSPASVSRALRGLPGVAPVARERILALIEDLDYVPSRVAASLPSGRYGVVAFVDALVGDWSSVETSRAVIDVFDEAGYDVLSIQQPLARNSDGDPRGRIRASFLKKRVDAVLAVGHSFNREVVSELQDLAVPMLVLGAQVPGVRSVAGDDRRARQLARDYLRDLGHQQVLTLRQDDASPWIAAAGAVADPAANLTQLNMREEGTATRRSRPLPWETGATAVVCRSDEQAFGLLLAARRSGIAVPAELSVVGQGDHPWASAFGLTTIRTEPYQLGRQAAASLLSELLGEPAHGRPGKGFEQLVVRESTGPAPAS